MSLLEGRIVLNNQLQREEELLLLPNEQVILDKRVKTMKKEWKRDGINIEWITGRLFFDEIPLPEVAQILERNYALKTIWVDDNYFNARSMDVYITKLRKLLKDDPGIEIINIHGKGYKLITPSGEEAAREEGIQVL